MPIYTPEHEAYLERRSRYLVRRFLFFWPIVTGSDDVERISLFNYWACIALAGIEVVGVAHLLLNGGSSADLWFPCLVGLAAVLFFFLGANAVRLRSVSAALGIAVVAGIHLANGFLLDRRLEWDRLIAFAFTLLILRGTLLAARYQPSPNDPEPLRLLQFFGRKPVDDWPRRLWPRWQWLFWISGAVQILSLALATYVALLPASDR